MLLGQKNMPPHGTRPRNGIHRLQADTAVQFQLPMSLQSRACYKHILCRTKEVNFKSTTSGLSVYFLNCFASIIFISPSLYLYQIRVCFKVLGINPDLVVNLFPLSVPIKVNLCAVVQVDFVAVIVLFDVSFDIIKLSEAGFYCRLCFRRYSVIRNPLIVIVVVAVITAQNKSSPPESERQPKPLPLRSFSYQIPPCGSVTTK